VEALRKELRKVIESYRNPEAKEGAGIVNPQDSRLTLGATIECLEFIRSMVSAYQTKRAPDTAYVDFLARFFPREEARSSIILP
jgi:hypothetical protein